MLYVVFLVVGDGLAALIGFYVQSQTSSAASLVVFLSRFFFNFAVFWMATIFIMDGPLKNAWGEQEQLEAERRGKALRTEISRAPGGVIRPRKRRAIA
jgi:preprotein translocase subunit SecG